MCWGRDSYGDIERVTDSGRPRPTMSRAQKIFAIIGGLVVLLILVGIIAGGSSNSSSLTSSRTSSTTAATVTQTVTRTVRQPGRGRVRTVVRQTPAPPARTVTDTVTSTATGAGSTAPSTASPSAGVEQPGSTSHATDEQFCNTHNCIPNFPNGNGTIVQCTDGEWSHSGGLSGACSDHGGED